MDDRSETRNLVSILQRALFYESQFRTAIVSDAISFYDCNISKDQIDTEIFYKDENGKFKSTMELIGITTPCKFSDFINTWIKKYVPSEYKTKYPFLTDLRQHLLDVFEEGKRDIIIEYWFTNEVGKRIFIVQRFLLTQNEDGDVYALSVVKNNTTNKKNEDKLHKSDLEHYAYCDPITHGDNYIKFKRRLNELSLSGAIIAVDVHSFKVINSSYGVEKGDEVIGRIWNVIENSLENFKKQDLAGHINADHFIIFVPSVNKKVIIEKLNSIRYGLNAVSVELGIPQMQPYFGVAKWYPGKRVELSYSEAVTAKHKAKNLKDAYYAFFDSEDKQRLAVEKKILDSFEDARAKHEFNIWLQPKYNPVNHKLVGAEALVRWFKKENGETVLVSPGDFIPVLERNGMISKLDEYIFRNVCILQQQWMKEGKKCVPVSINVSRATLYHKNIVDIYKKHAEDFNVEKSLLPIEITESAAVTNSEISDIAEAFHKAGFNLHMDDFGSGYSSLASLNNMHFDTLKLDKSLIDYIGNFGGERLLEHTILLAKELGLHVTAEGVEKEDQVSFLRRIGCDSIQGYFYDKPMPAEDFEKRLDMQEAAVASSDFEFLNGKIMDFKNSIMRTPVYTFISNLSKNEYYEDSGIKDFSTETKIQSNCFSEAVELLAENYFTQEYKEAYKQFMNREAILESFKGENITRVLNYKRMYKGGLRSMRMMTETFKVDDSEDIWMYISVVLL